MNRREYIAAEAAGFSRRGMTDQELCWHMMGIVGRLDGGQTIIDRDNADLLDKMGGYKFSYCPICGKGLT